MSQALPVSSGAVEIIDTGYPPAGDVCWLAWTNAGQHRSTVVHAQRWFDARMIAARELGVLIDAVDAVETEKLVACWTVTFEASLGRVA